MKRILVLLVLSQWLYARSLDEVHQRLTKDGQVPLAHGAFHAFRGERAEADREAAKPGILAGIKLGMQWAKDHDSVFLFDSEFRSQCEFGIELFAQALKDFPLKREQLHVNLKLDQVSLGLMLDEVILKGFMRYSSERDQVIPGLVSKDSRRYLVENATESVLSMAKQMGLDKFPKGQNLPDVLMLHADFFSG